MANNVTTNRAATVVTVKTPGPQGPKGDTGPIGPQGIPSFDLSFDATARNLTASGDISASGDLYSTNLYASGNITASGDLLLMGDTTLIGQGTPGGSKRDILKFSSNNVTVGQSAVSNTYLYGNNVSIKSFSNSFGEGLYLTGQNGIYLYGNDTNGTIKFTKTSDPNPIIFNTAAGHISASGNISASGDLYTTQLYVNNDNAPAIKNTIPYPEYNIPGELNVGGWETTQYNSTPPTHNTKLTGKNIDIVPSGGLLLYGHTDLDRGLSINYDILGDKSTKLIGSWEADDISLTSLTATGDISSSGGTVYGTYVSASNTMYALTGSFNFVQGETTTGTRNIIELKSNNILNIGDTDTTQTNIRGKDITIKSFTSTDLTLHSDQSPRSIVFKSSTEAQPIYFNTTNGDVTAIGTGSFEYLKLNYDKIPTSDPGIKGTIYRDSSNQLFISPGS